ncbi:MAG: glycosyl hydrolase family protein [Ruminococcaceae bacterium]|nr:glycosyl hydrolase family protein [Oscillospiraceae bacterium]
MDFVHNYKEKEAMKKYDVKDHEPSVLPDGYEFELVWSDEFDGDKLDETKWDYRLCMMGKRHPAWTDKGVKIENGCAVFSIFEENGEIVSSQLQTGYNFMDQPVEKTTFGKEHLQWPIGKLKDNKFTHRYGYYECRCKLQEHTGWRSAFWIQSPIIGASNDSKKTGTEIDIMECFVANGAIKPHNAFTGGYGLDMKRSKVGGKNVSPDEFHTFGLLWLPDKYVFYIDGEEDGVITDKLSDTDEFILISTETDGYRNEDHRPTEEAIQAAKAGDKFVVDFVRVFDIKE